MVAELTKIDPVTNTNRYVRLVQEGPVFTKTVGRNGVDVGFPKRMPMSVYQSVYDGLIKEGYTERKGIRSVKHRKFKEIDDPAVRSVIAYLLDRSRKYADETYSVSYEAVTKEMLAEARGILDVMRTSEGLSEEELNKMLLHLFSVIPRKMKTVNDWLISPENPVGNVIDREQGFYDSLNLQVAIGKTEEESPEKTVLESFGVEMRPATAEETAQIIRHLSPRMKSRFTQAFKVSNKATGERFERYMESHGLTENDVHYHYHGSRAENWFGLTVEGPRIHADAVRTGWSLGPGTYLANSADKSGGYMDGGCWNNGKSSRCFMGVFKAAYKNPKHLKTHCEQFNSHTIAPYDAVFLHGGGVFLHDEIVVYRKQQLDQEYLLEFKG